MKHFSFTVIALCSLFAVQGAVAQGGNFGLGVMVGEPAGISAKLWTSDINAFDVGIGWSIGGDQMGMSNRFYYGGNRLHLHADYLWHSFEALRSSERYPLFFGIGGRINGGNDSKASLAVRGVLGVAWLPLETPMDIFLEPVPMFQLSPSSGFGIDAGVGARYFF